MIHSRNARRRCTWGRYMRGDVHGGFVQIVQGVLYYRSIALGDGGNSNTAMADLAHPTEFRA